MDLDVFATLCRICLQSFDDSQMISILQKNDEKLTLFEKIKICGGMTMPNDADGLLPTRICKKCSIFLSFAYKFHVILQNSNNYLRELSRSSFDSFFEYDNTESIDYIEQFFYEFPLSSIKQKETTYTAKLPEQTTTFAESKNELVTFEETVEHTFEQINIETDSETWQNEVAEEDFTYFIEEDNTIYDDTIEPENVDSEIVETLETADDATLLEVEEDHEHNAKNGNEIPSEVISIASDNATVFRLKKSRTAKGKEPHICEICGNIYLRKCLLEAHMRRHRDEKPFQCELCQEAFHFNFQLSRHIRKHTGARPYKCQYCNREFTDGSAKVKHERVHRNERPYKCEICSKTFTYSSSLRAHILIHTGKKPYSCGICEKRFTRSHQLRAHLETLQHSKDPRSKILLTQILPDDRMSRISQ